MEKSFRFQEITEKDELEVYFRLRYEIYSNSIVKGLIRENKNHIDIDYFDIHSRHYSLMNGNNIAGYFRVVLPKNELTNTKVLEIGQKYQLLDETEYFHKNGRAPFPFLCYEGVPRSYWEYYNELHNKNEQLAESSRLILHPDYRSIRTSKFLVECAMALFILICIGKMHAVVSCRHDHGSFYENSGFIPIANGESFINHEFNTIAFTLPLSQSLSTSSVPKQLHAKIEEMAEEFRSTGKIEREL
jgi:hypothetical protein